MLLQVYHDASQSDGFLTLCGVAATESVWLEMGTQWSAALSHHRVDRFHMVDLMSFNGEFRRARGWDSAKRKLLLQDLFNVIGKFRGAAYHLVARSCSVDLEIGILLGKNFHNYPRLRPCV